jgi:hypothetical protein
MKPTTRATTSAVAAAIIAFSSFLGTQFLALAVLLMILVTAFGWPLLMRTPHIWVTRWILAPGGSIALVAVLLGRTEPYLRYMVVALAGMVLLALASEIFFPSPRGRALTSVAAITAGTIILTAGTAWVAASRTSGSENLVIAASVALFVSSVTSIATKSVDVNAILSLVLGAGTGAAAGTYLDNLTWYVGGAAGLASAMVVMLMAELYRREPATSNVWAGISSGTAPVLSAGLLVYIGGRLLLG